MAGRCPNTANGQHYWVLIREERRGRHTYRFYECAACSQPRMEIV